jgi:hypothetical protein
VDDRTKIIFDALINAAEAAKHVLKQFEDASAKANESGPPPETPEGQSTEGEEASTNQPTATETPEGGDGASLQDYGCVLRMLPKRLLLQAASTAVKINPLNAPHVTGRTDGLSAAPVEPLHIALLTTKYWGPQQRQLTVSFMETTPADLRNRIISHMNAWNARCGISFVFTNGTGQVRISRGQGGYYSYLGTDILHIPAGHQTMNLQGFTMNTPESEYKRVVRHETGHTLGSPHEHMRKELVALLDPQKTVAWFEKYQGWDAQTVREQVLTPLDDASIMGTPTDQDSIMCYQLSGSITKNGQPIRGGVDINESDYAFMARIYPPPPGSGGDDLDWLV